MGHSRTPTFRIEETCQTGTRLWQTSGSWEIRSIYRADGKPTRANLEKHVRAFELSTQQNGVNAHLGASIVRSAKIIRQSSGEIVATYAG